MSIEDNKHKSLGGLFYSYILPFLVGIIVFYFTFGLSGFPEVFYISGIEEVVSKPIYDASIALVKLFAFVSALLIILSFSGLILFSTKYDSNLANYVNVIVFILYVLCSISFYNFIFVMSIFNPSGFINFIIANGIPVFISFPLVVFFIFSVVLVFGSVDVVENNLLG